MNTSRRPHLLYIAFWYPPSRASGVYRALATTRQFVQAGWDVSVISCSYEFLANVIGSVDLSLIAEIPLGVDVHRVPQVADLDIRSLNRMSANIPVVWSKAQGRMKPMRQRILELQGAVPETNYFTDKYLGWIDPVVKTGMKVDGAKPVDHVLATANPYAALETARILAGVIGVEFSVDYRDPWTIDVFTERRDLADRATRETERRIVAEAWRCFHVNEAIAEAYSDVFPEHAAKQCVVYNGYDAESLPPIRERTTPALRFGILGTLNDLWPMDPIFSAWGSIGASLAPGSQLVIGGHLGYFARSAEILMRSFPEDSALFRYAGPIPKVEVASFYDEIDVVIVPVAGGRMVTSGKVFEANALGKPVVCVQAPDGGARRILADNPLAVCADPNAEAVEEALLTAVELAGTLDLEMSRQVRTMAGRFERHVALQPMVDEISSLLVPGRAV